MPVDINNPQDVQAFTQAALQRGASPEQVSAYLAQKKAAVAPPVPTQSDQTPWQQGSVGGFAGNIVKSAGGTLGSIGSALINTLNPDMSKNTVANLAKTGIGAVQLAIPGEQGQEQYARAVGNFYKNRYGSLQAIGDTLYNDPVGALLDASVVADVGGSALAKVGDIAKIDKLVTAGKAVKDVGEAINPLNIAGKAISGVANKVAGKTADLTETAGKDLAVKALKPSPSQVVNFENTTGIPLKDYIEQNGLYGAGKTAAAQAETKLIKPLQEQYNALTRTGATISGEELATALEQKALDILQNDHSAAARSVADGLWKEADTTRKLGDITDTVLTNSKTSSFGKVPGNVMQDATAFNVNKAVATVSRDLLDKVAPGSAELGRQLEAARLFKEIATKQSGLGAGSNLISALRPPGFAGGAGFALGSVAGNPVLGAVIGAGVGAASEYPPILSAASRGAELAAKGITKIPSAVGKATQLATIPSRLVPAGAFDGVGNSINSPNYNNNPNYPQGQGTTKEGYQQSEGNFPNSGVSINNSPTNENGYQQSPVSSNQLHTLPSDPSSITMGSNTSSIASSAASVNAAMNQPEYLNPFGASPEQIYEAYVKTSMSGNKRKAAILYQMFKDETAYQAKKNPKVNSSGAAALSDSQTALSVADDLADTIEQSKSIMGPVKGYAAARNPYDTNAQIFNSQMETAAQIIGKALEGGVLRQEDVVKYRRILPQITDLPSVAKAKIAKVKALLNTRYQNQTEFYRNAQPDVSPVVTPDTTDLTAGGGGLPPKKSLGPVQKALPHYMFR